MDFALARTKMVDCQIRTCDVTDQDVLSAFLKVPREEFVDKAYRQLAYIDEDLPLGSSGRYLMEPAPFSKLLQVASIKKSDVVLVVGAGCGYTSAVISLLASSVVSIEEDEELAQTASENLMRLGFDNVAIIGGSFTQGCTKEAPFDVIFINGAVDFVPDNLLEQLTADGQLIAVEGTGNAGNAKVYERIAGVNNSRNIMNCSVKPLPGFEKIEEFKF